MSADGVREGRDRGAVRSRPIEARMALGGGASPVVSLALSGFRWVAIERERESKPESERESKPESERESKPEGSLWFSLGRSVALLLSGAKRLVALLPPPLLLQAPQGAVDPPCLLAHLPLSVPSC